MFKNIIKNDILREIIDWVLHIAIAVALGFFIVTYVAQITIVEGHSMEKSLQNGDRLIIEKISPRFGKLHKGDIITINHPQGVSNEKRLEYPVKIKCRNPKMAKYIITQYGGPDGELAASIRYLSQRFSMPTNEAKAILNDIGTEELAHLEIVGSIVHQLTKGVPANILEQEGLGAYYSDHDHAIYPVSASGVPFTAACLQSKGDPIADLHEDLAAEQKARATYENLIKLCDDPDVIDPLKFLREREVVHFQRFGEALDIVQDKLAQKKFYF